MSMSTVWMTPTARERLELEIEELQRELTAGREADQVRLLQLRDLLRKAEVDRKPDDGLVEPGMVITIRFERDGSTSTFLLGSRDLKALDPELDAEVYSPESPLGAAISGRYVGDVVTFAAPAGEQQVAILSAVPFA
jgi:transcription elongation factor GreA